ncbi:MAG: hypothetical protein OEY28_13760, partial [Nitrospira sp.]|nr:hypothetical protein [Nitrospira sp.]
MAVRTLTLRIALIAAVLLLGCLAPAPGPSAPVLVASETASAKAPSKAEKSARDKAAKAAEKFADWCARVGAYDEARRYYSVAAVCTGSIDAYLALFRKIADKPHSPTEMYDKDKAKERAKLWSKGGKPLLDFIKSTWKSLEIDQAREAMAIWSLFFRDDEQLMNSGWRWSERYSLLLPEKDSIKLEMGMIPFRGKWLDKEELEATDGNHSVWKARYKISDGRSLLETPAKLRIAYWAMGLITRFRVFLLAETMLALELKLPEVRQPVWLTRTREEYGERMKALGKERGKEYRVGS